MPEKQAAKTVAPRTPLKKVELTRNSRASELRNRSPGFTYRAFSLEADHPDYIGKRLRPHEIGDESVGFATVAAWEVCQDAINEKVQALEVRTDQGAKVDTTERYGRQIVCRLPDEEYAKYLEVDRARREQRRQQLYGKPDRLRYGGTATVTTVTALDNDSSEDGLLRQAGHPMPA